MISDLTECRASTTRWIHLNENRIYSFFADMFKPIILSWSEVNVISGVEMFRMLLTSLKLFGARPGVQLMKYGFGWTKWNRMHATCGSSAEPANCHHCERRSPARMQPNSSLTSDFMWSTIGHGCWEAWVEKRRKGEWRSRTDRSPHLCNYDTVQHIGTQGVWGRMKDVSAR